MGDPFLTWKINTGKNEFNYENTFTYSFKFYSTAFIMFRDLSGMNGQAQR